jgi:hypothetical protein
MRTRIITIMELALTSPAAHGTAIFDKVQK